MEVYGNAVGRSRCLGPGKVISYDIIFETGVELACFDDDDRDSKYDSFAHDVHVWKPDGSH